jgi:NAD(P)H-hydrate epimerase
METIGIPGLVLMENAGRSVADFASQALKDLKGRQVCIFCGTGNNGGDGLVAARHMINQGISVRLAICGDINRMTEDARINMDILDRLGQPIENLDLYEPAIHKVLERLTQGTDLLIDALLGTGLAGQVKPEMARLIDALNSLRRPILAVDIPSGLDCDSGIPLGAAVRARWTMTFVAYKKGFLEPNAPVYTGQVMVAQIGIPLAAWPGYKP